ncbi:MAG TPA: acetyl-CoA carboxylase biotin carboxyl carrier protein [Phycisphaerales bacterium]|nr:acetyl-CoA carboxylase biotin carboxyl carrier protein [Phycisphaerales bacterium]
MIDMRKLEELVRLMVENDLAELDLHDEQEGVTIKRGLAPGAGTGGAWTGAAATPAPQAGAARGTGVNAGGAPGSNGAPAAGSAPEAEAGLTAIVSPMVGTFYATPNPDSPAFVSAGSRIGPDTTVCLIEAMKVFNEIKSECSGVVERVLVESGTPVEYGQKLFLVRPA